MTFREWNCHVLSTPAIHTIGDAAVSTVGYHTSFPSTIGGFIHILLVIAIIVVFIRIIRGEKIIK
ncbi:hypothetical protein A2348_01375 [Candidatus Uhrbacteria bacterium RIFOXYB12_FULL_58_10]|uniref:Uncharacterized protein n=1 Tax=Candidatus Uhrbacteria bacterium RIFOXYB2_FULL_57_15 TaxID=1802422 RepID=A0A1F7W5E6_9BACT|nr:MAG: hypothetical protein A2348_01375 [Candidatus Uhrbacteria bacterium RIFOXYB12_FULL_58_10]OGL98033.1 MAG: hypothetical protein A2304_00805 [Candidatus Uhrbacteria bacterium RIFOXYB2_FULL_57_15]OGL99295.1 MAG: hypothetical protein A2501_03985 [Candidatus Uhrbacteria bacterium RIFOXYC12_FULL_57_11]